MLIFHIFTSLVALSVGLIGLIKVSSLSSRLIRFNAYSSFLSFTSGVALIFNGASILRVCLESVILLMVVVALQYAYRVQTTNPSSKLN